MSASVTPDVDCAEEKRRARAKRRACDSYLPQESPPVRGFGRYLSN